MDEWIKWINSKSIKNKIKRKMCKIARTGVIKMWCWNNEKAYKIKESIQLKMREKIDESEQNYKNNKGNLVNLAKGIQNKM